jgi:hypothetical protein
VTSMCGCELLALQVTQTFSVEGRTYQQRAHSLWTTTSILGNQSCTPGGRSLLEGAGLLRLGRKVGHADVENKGLKDFTIRRRSSSSSINDRIVGRSRSGRQGSLRRGEDDDDVEVHAAVEYHSKTFCWSERASGRADQLPWTHAGGGQVRRCATIGRASKTRSDGDGGGTKAVVMMVRNRSCCC